MRSILYSIEQNQIIRQIVCISVLFICTYYLYFYVTRYSNVSYILSNAWLRHEFYLFTFLSMMFNCVKSTFHNPNLVHCTIYPCIDTLSLIHI